MNQTFRRSLAVVAFASTTAIVTLAGCSETQNDFLRVLLNPGIDVSPVAVGVSPVAVGPLDDPIMTAGLKEALRVGVERTIDSTSKTDGYLGNQLIRIPLPSGLSRTDSAPSTVCLDCQVDRFEISMNRAAERAAGEAGRIFLGALRDMTLPDAADMMKGCDAAATNYFRAKASGALMEELRPIVSAKMADVGLYNLYDGLNKSYADFLSATAPSTAPAPGVNLDDYVTRRTLDGLFAVLAQEEIRIRKDPDARTTALLRRVFGGN